METEAEAEASGGGRGGKSAGRSGAGMSCSLAEPAVRTREVGVTCSEVGRKKRGEGRKKGGRTAEPASQRKARSGGKTATSTKVQRGERSEEKGTGLGRETAPSEVARGQGRRVGDEAVGGRLGVGTRKKGQRVSRAGGPNRGSGSVQPGAGRVCAVSQLDSEHSWGQQQQHAPSPRRSPPARRPSAARACSPTARSSAACARGAPG